MTEYAIKGYRRPSGPHGVRNHYLILPASICATTVANRIAALTPGAIVLQNQHGCGQLGSDYQNTRRTLAGFGRNPNVGAVLVVGLGCEAVQAQSLAEEIAESGKPVDYLVIQECGGTLKTAAQGAELALTRCRELSAAVRETFPPGELILGLECGGSDPTSGLAANPAIGRLTDHLVALGGSAILSETTEALGAEHLLAERFPDPEERRKFLALIDRVEQRALDMGVDLRDGQPSPGNKAGGLSTIEEKSLGCILKAGAKSPFLGAIEYSEPLPAVPGLYLMDSPGHDIESISGMVASGAQIIVFSTGLGTPTGSPVTPVIKITGNNGTYKNMIDHIDLNAGTIISGEAGLEDIGRQLFELFLEVANGRLTKAEILGHQEFAIFKTAGSF